MGIISLEKQDHLFWLGRYSERVFTTIRTFLYNYDKMLDDEATTYKTICAVLDIPDIYDNQEDFIKKYIYSHYDPNSIYTNLRHAYDNAIVLRDEISSESLSYIQMTMDCMEEHSADPFSLLHLQQVLDLLFAFWGSVDDMVLSETIRDVLKAGRYLERIDLYIRLDYPRASLDKEYAKFEHRMSRLSPMQYDVEMFKLVRNDIAYGGDLHKLLGPLNKIFTR